LVKVLAKICHLYYLVKLFGLVQILNKEKSKLKKILLSLFRNLHQKLLRNSKENYQRARNKTVISKSKIKTKSDKKEKVMTRNLQKSKDK